MGVLTWVCGKTGSGKSTSICPVETENVKIKGLDPESTVIINTDQKPLPSKKVRELYSDDRILKNVTLDNITATLTAIGQGQKIKSIVIDTWTRLNTNTVDGHAFQSSNGFEKWNGIVNKNVELMNTINNVLRDDLIVYLFAHPEVYTNESGMPDIRVAFEGKKLGLRSVESYSSIVLCTEKVNTPGQGVVYSFNTNGLGPAKTPLEMFEKTNIPNDLGLVDDTIRDYYGL